MATFVHAKLFFTFDSALSKAYNMLLGKVGKIAHTIFRFDWFQDWFVAPDASSKVLLPDDALFIISGFVTIRKLCHLDLHNDAPKLQNSSTVWLLTKVTLCLFAGMFILDCFGLSQLSTKLGEKATGGWKREQRYTYVESSLTSSVHSTSLNTTQESKRVLKCYSQQGSQFTKLLLSVLPQKQQLHIRHMISMCVYCSCTALALRERPCNESFP